MSQPLISILVPCHNAAPWIGTALQSALEQTWPRVEIIMVDDGSTDESCVVARRFASSWCRIFVQPHRGASAARNRAFSLARGDYIQYLDADDLLAPGKLEKQMRIALELGNKELSFGSSVHFFDEPHRGEEHRVWLKSEGSDPVEFLSELWNGEGPEEMVQPAQWLTPRGLIEEAGPWNEALSVDDDGEFFARVILTSRRIVAVPGALSYYRKFRNGKNLSACACRKSAMSAAQLKSEYLLRQSNTDRARQAVRRLVTREIIDAYPAFPQVVASGVRFLRERGLSFADRLEGSPWFRRLAACLGWKAARQLQWRWRRRSSGPVSGSLPSGDSPAAGNRCPRRPAAGHCNRRRAIDRLRA